MDAVVLTEGSADAWSVKALRAGMGAQLRVCVVTDVNWTFLKEYLSENRISTHVAAAHDSAICYTDVDWQLPSALVIGSEADGVSSQSTDAAKYLVQIPMANGVESLNAAMAGTIILFEARRQRQGENF